MPSQSARKTTPAEQELIGKLLTHTPAPRQSFIDWWHAVDVELRCTHGTHNASMWGETNWRYRAHRRMTPKECAALIVAERAC